MRVTLLCSDLSTNGLSRTALLAEILAGVADVQIVGTCFQRGIWPPARNMKVPISVVPGADWPRYWRQIPKLLELVNGDVVIARKPVLSGFGVALRARARRAIPVVLDIDDDEIAFRAVRGLRRLTALRHPNNPWTTRHYTKRTARADAIIVASYGLQRRFGGVVVPHAKNTNVLRPQPELAEAAKTRLGLSGRKVVMFMGSPRPHKGVEDAAAAMLLLRHADAVLAVVGADETPYVQDLKRKYPALHYSPPYALSEVGFLLQAADAVVVPQRDTATGRDQLPAKLLDAMAVAKPVVATAVSDIPRILGRDRGWLVPPGDAPALAHALDAIFDDPDSAAETGRRARAWVVQNASYDSVRDTLLSVLASAIDRRAQSR